MTLTVLIPAYNEAERITATVAVALALPDVNDVLVIDDGSTDDTTRRATAAGARVLTLKQNGGKAAALTAGLQATTSEFLLLLDADLGATAAEASKLSTPVLQGDADMTVALFPVVPGRGGGMGIVLRLARWGVKRATGKTMQAPLSGQRCLKRAVLEAALPLAEGFGIETGLDISALKAGFRVLEVPTTMDHRVTQNDLAGRLHRLRQLRDVAKALLR
ncbi:glycosyltransferase family 2 protein [Armatimonas rosea]|uniref:Glucosyl-3-phosphoglycerate synthase n=1 Tax=Armatimonas rosea TaxID=685828 RepID=A0A7W9W750_ARMRO|nr:glycosyltransferase family 2 protein [Armatimonas rosea]MBB6052099.1 glycosyltransferase involved in cell wall biosynthesis [Armatimonas rosea]